ncbi:MAG: methyltransferase [Pseudomonadota bacterium]
MTGLRDDLTEDAFLGGRVHVLQPRTGYRAATDPVLLAALVNGRPGQRVLDVGCGAGTALACLAARVPGLELHGIEVQEDYAALARCNLPQATIWTGDLLNPPVALKAMQFDWVLTNPPFFDAAGAASPDAGRDKARREAVPPQDWAAACLRRVRSAGHLAVIHRTDRVPDLLSGLVGAGDISLIPLQARIGRPAKRVLIRARQGAGGPFRILPPLILHEGAEHGHDGDDFSLEALKILRDAQAVPMC